MRDAALVPLLLAAMLALGAEEPKMGPKLEPPDALPPAPAGQAWRPVWHDEFDAEKLDDTKWEFLEGKWRAAACTRKAVSLDGKGHLVIRTFKEGEDYFTGVVRTRGKFEHTFGFYVARIQLQKQGGHWSAFWLWNVGTRDAPTLEGSPLRFEVDIMERPWTDDRIQHTLHWGPYPKGGKSLGEVARVAGVGQGWHTFAVLWTPDEFVFYVDGKETWRPRGVEVCQRPLYILLSDEAEFAGWAGDVRRAALPDEFLTDYVRVYDLVDAKTGQAVWKPKPLASAPGK